MSHVIKAIAGSITVVLLSILAPFGIDGTMTLNQVIEALVFGVITYASIYFAPANTVK